MRSVGLPELLAVVGLFASLAVIAGLLVVLYWLVFCIALPDIRRRRENRASDTPLQ
jgi:hypothetical protein